MPKVAAAGIPSYSSSGRRLRNYSLAAIERCLVLDPPSVAVKRSKRTGRITSAQFLPLPQNSCALEGNETLRKTAHMGQHYSYPEAVDEQGHRSWRFAKFLWPRDMNVAEPEEIERELQRVFRAVPLSCLVRG